MVNKVKTQVFGAGELVMSKIDTIINPPPETNKFVLAFMSTNKPNPLKDGVQAKEFTVERPLDLLIWKTANKTFDALDQFLLGIELNLDTRIRAAIVKQDLKDEGFIHLAKLCPHLKVLTIENCGLLTDQSLRYSFKFILDGDQWFFCAMRGLQKKH
jgi:hypothetical protein